MGLLKYFKHKKWSISNKKHVINFKTLKGTENEMIRFWEFKIEMQMPSHDTILLLNGGASFGWSFGPLSA